MPEGKTKSRARNRKTKPTRATTLISKAKAKPAAASVSAARKPRSATKRSTVKPKAAAAKRRAVRTAAPTPIFQSSRPLTPLPKPLEITPQPGYSYSASPRANRLDVPHRWSLRHNIFTIVVLTVVGFIALIMVASYAQVTFQYIDIYGSSQSSVLKPVSLTERSFALDAGTFTMAYPANYVVGTTTTDTINWEHITQPTTTAQLHVHKNESDNEVTWLQQNQPTYNSAKVVTPTTAVDAVDGILVEASSANGDDVLVAYWAYQKNLAEKYIIEMMITVDPDDAVAVTMENDLDLFVSGLEISE